MAGKSRRVASRQAQLGRKRKKQPKGAAAPTSTVMAPVEVDGQHTETAVPRVVEPTTPTPSPTPSPATAPVPARPTATPAVAPRSASASRTPGRARGERLATSSYIGAEMRRILILAVAVLVIIVVLGFIL